MNKINFFNEVMAIHDLNESVYNEKVADLIFSESYDEFNVFYEIYERIKELYDVEPDYFLFLSNEEGGMENICKFTLRVNDKKQIDEIFKELKENGTNITTCYCSSKCIYKKNSKKGLITIEVIKVKRFFDVSKNLIKGKMVLS